MMDHIINFDWNYREPEEHFIKPEDLDNSVTERILRNKFHDPLISSDEETEEKRPPKIDWQEVFAEREDTGHHRVYVPGHHPIKSYLKLSALSMQQHHQCMKVLCAQNPQILPTQFRQRPTLLDKKTFENIREIYEKEQQEFKDWAKVLWASDHCRRVLRPKPRVETLYEAFFKVKALEMQTFPKMFRFAAQIPMETANQTCEMVHQEDLFTVNLEELPAVDCPVQITTKITIMKPLEMPEPCQRHPCRFIPPGENSVTQKSLSEVNRALALLASRHRATCVVAEGALRCLVERDRPWSVPVTVEETDGADGEPCNVLVLGSEFTDLKEPPPTRNYKAFRHMLNVALIQDTELSKVRYIPSKAMQKGSTDANKNSSFQAMEPETDASSDEECMMIIDADDDPPSSPPRTRQSTKKQRLEEKVSDNDSSYPNEVNQNLGKPLPECSCKGTRYEYPPPRSYRRWRLRNTTTNDNIDVIVHCTHKLKNQDKYEELLLEPQVEYQLDLAASEQTEGRIKSLALALMLRKNATLSIVRVDASNGNLVTVDQYSANQYNMKHGDIAPGIANTLHSTLSQLQGLLPGNYVLKHDPSHGANAILYSARGVSRVAAEAGAPGAELVLQWDALRLAEPDEGRSVRTPPTLVPVLLPIHKFRSILPLAFTYNGKQVAREPKKPVTRQRPPPQALQLDDGEKAAAGRKKWPKKKGHKKKARQ